MYPNTELAPQCPTTAWAAESSLNDRIDDAYREKYGASQYLPPMLTAKTRGVTVEITPRGEN